MRIFRMRSKEIAKDVFEKKSHSVAFNQNSKKTPSVACSNVYWDAMGDSGEVLSSAIVKGYQAKMKRQEKAGSQDFTSIYG